MDSMLHGTCSGESVRATLLYGVRSMESVVGCLYM